jgi:ADP-heptose:LPS heptosyltransferase
MGWGDEIVAAGQAQRVFDATGLRVVICGSDFKPRWHDIWRDNPVILNPQRESWKDALAVQSGPGCRPYIVYPFSEQTGWTFNKAFRCRDHIAKLYLTPEEWARGMNARLKYGPYVLIEPFTKHQNFRWSLERWHQLVAACPDLTFVQHVHADSPLVIGAFVEQATFREACGLVASAAVYVRSESGMCHAAAALGTRQVTLFGGCMDPEVMGYYPRQTVLADTGEGSPCGRWLPCDHCAAAMDRLTVGEVVRALRARLTYAERVA